MKIPRIPLSKEAREHFKKKVERGEKFAGREKMVKRLEMYDRGHRKSSREKPQFTKELDSG